MHKVWRVEKHAARYRLAVNATVFLFPSLLVAFFFSSFFFFSSPPPSIHLLPALLRWAAALARPCLVLVLGLRGRPDNLPHALFPALARVLADAPSASAAEATRGIDFG